MLIDLNADLGEGAGTDADLMPLITSANVCCGGYAGSHESRLTAAQLAKAHGVTVGAHPGYPDRVNFGRVEMTFQPNALFEYLNKTLAWFSQDVERIGVSVRYLKPHGALYNQACRERSLAEVVVLARRSFHITGAAIVGLPGSQLELVANEIEAAFIPEGFADRRYRPDGSLVPRTHPDAMLHDPKEAVEQVEWLIGKQQVRTICVHGDTPGAVEFVKAVRGFLLDRGHELKAFA